MEAQPPLSVNSFLPPQLLGLCLYPLDVMTLLLQRWLESSGDPSSFFGDYSLFAGFILLASLDVRVENQQTENVLEFFSFHKLLLEHHLCLYFMTVRL